MSAGSIAALWAFACVGPSQAPEPRTSAIGGQSPAASTTAGATTPASGTAAFTDRPVVIEIMASGRASGGTLRAVVSGLAPSDAVEITIVSSPPIRRFFEAGHGATVDLLFDALPGPQMLTVRVEKLEGSRRFVIATRDIDLSRLSMTPSAPPGPAGPEPAVTVVVSAAPIPAQTPAPSAAVSPTTGPTGSLRLAQTFVGQDRRFGGWPPDVTIAAGPASIIVFSNDGITIREKSGTIVADQGLNQFFDPLRRPREGLIDPTAVFDPHSGRFFLVAAAAYRDDPDCQLGRCVANTYLAVSKSSTPLTTTMADWYLFALDATLEDGVSTTNFPDHARVGVNDQLLVIATDQVSFKDETGQHPLLRVLAKTPLTSGQLPRWKDFVGMRLADGRLAQQFQPVVHLDRRDDGEFFLLNDSGCDLTTWAISNGLTAPSLRAVRAVSSALPPPGVRCAQPPDAPQSGTPIRLGTGRERPTLYYPAVYRLNSLWAVQHVEAGFPTGAVGGIRWIEIDVTGWPSRIAFRQEGYLATEGVWRFFPSIAVSSRGDVALIFGRSGRSEHPSVEYTGRLGSDPLGALRPAVTLRTSPVSLIDEPGRTSDRPFFYGDYFGAAIDPSDESAWIVGEWIPAPDMWSTWVGRIDWSVVP